MESKDWNGFGYFSPDLEPEHLRGHWKCSKSIFSIQSKKKNVKQ